MDNILFGGLVVINPEVYYDNRGWFMEEYNKQKYEAKGIRCDFIQDNHSSSLTCGTIRGIHYQNAPMAQAKLVSCPRGAILDIAVDLRQNSATYKQYVAVELSAENKKKFFIPRGFGHAFVTLTDNTEVFYKVDNYYSKEHDRTIFYDDPDINIHWPYLTAIVSDKDNHAPLLKDGYIDFGEWV